MPEVRVNGATLHYDVQGNGPEAILFAHGLLLSGAMYAAQVSALKERYRCITFDFRGHGLSETTPSGYDFDTFTEDVAALIETVGCTPCHFVGHSMGGFVGLRLAIRHPRLLRSLVLVDSSADPESPRVKGRYRLMTFVARYLGPRLVVSRVMPIMFGRRFLTDPARRQEREEWHNRLAANDRRGATRSVDAVIDRSAVSGLLSRVGTPTLVIVGGDDVAIAPAKSEALHAAIRGSRLVVLPGIGHTPPIEAPEAVTRAIEEFFSQVTAG